MGEERTLCVFEGEETWFVAYDQDDAWDLWEEFTGEHRKDYDFVWKLLPDDRKLLITIEDDDDQGDKVRTCAEWVAQCGRGFLCGTNY